MKSFFCSCWWIIDTASAKSGVLAFISTMDTICRDVTMFSVCCCQFLPFQWEAFRASTTWCLSKPQLCLFHPLLQPCLSSLICHQGNTMSICLTPSLGCIMGKRDVAQPNPLGDRVSFVSCQWDLWPPFVCFLSSTFLRGDKKLRRFITGWPRNYQSVLMETEKC